MMGSTRTTKQALGTHEMSFRALRFRFAGGLKLPAA